MQTKVNLDHEELQILLQCIFALNYNGKDIIKVGLLADKLNKEFIKMEESIKKEKHDSK